MFFILLSILLILLIFLLLIFLHELGHFYVAKASGVRVLEFSIGFGPKMFQWRDSDGVVWSIRWIPFGGYVLPVSESLIEEINRSLETYDQLNEVEKSLFENELSKIGLTVEEASNIDYSQSVESKKTTSKLLFSMGGIIVNYLIIWGALFAAYSTTGKVVSTNRMHYLPYVYDQVSKEIYVTDLTNVFVESVEANGEEYFTFDEIDEYIWTDSSLSTIQLNVKVIDENETSGITSFTMGRDTTNLNLNRFDDSSNLFIYDLPAVLFEPYQLIFNDYSTHDLAGIDKMNGIEAFGVSFVDSWKYFLQGFVLLFYLITPKQNVTPTETLFVGQNDNLIIFQIYVGNILTMMAILSALLISSNILPIPPLDGYRFTIYLYEGISKKKLKKETSRLLEKIGWGVVAFGTIWILFIASF